MSVLAAIMDVEAPAPSERPGAWPNPWKGSDMTQGTCAVSGCEREVSARGWCSTHYWRWQHHGGVSLPDQPSLEERFWAKVDRRGPDDCWEWRAYRRPNGYGQFDTLKVLGTNLAHRAAYLLLVGPIPAGLTLDHLCRNRGCVNPSHLEPVTAGENVLRGIGPTAANARRTHCIHGHPFSGGNLYMHPSGQRMCRTCRAGWDRKYKRNAKVAALERAAVIWQQEED